MFYRNYNDYELIYLVKEGSEIAKKMLFNKYTALIIKIYNEGQYKKSIESSDFLQEGLMILEKLINNYNEYYEWSFFSYFKLCFFRRIKRLYFENRFILKERTSSSGDFGQLSVQIYKYEVLVRQLKKTINEENKLIKKIFEECILYFKSVKYFSLKYNLDYKKTYYIYKKIRLMLKNVLTK